MATSIPIGLMRENMSDAREKIEFLGELSQRLLDKKDELKSVELKVKQLKAEISLLELNEIPDFMTECQLTIASTLTGRKVEVKPFFYARIQSLDENSSLDQVGRKAAQLEWLRGNNYGGLIKEQLYVVPDASKARLVMSFLSEQGIPFEEKSGVHHKTLESWLKELYINGKIGGVPLDLFDAVIGRKAVVK